MEQLNVAEVRIAYAKSLPESILEEIIEMNATMYDDDGGGQYELEALRDRFDENSEEYTALNSLINENYDYLEHS